MEFVLFTLFVGYLVPWFTAVAHDHHRHAAILAWTLLLGWTGIGWIAALAYALRSDPHPPRGPALRVVPGGPDGPGRAAVVQRPRREGDGRRDALPCRPAR